MKAKMKGYLIHGKNLSETIKEQPSANSRSGVI